MGKRSKSKYCHLKNKNYCDASSSNQAQGQVNNYESDIPGYYYDEEKKTYFKILPNTMSSVGSFVTKETIKRDREESRRQCDQNALDGENEKQTTTSSLFPIKKRTRPSTLEEPLLITLRSVQCGQKTCQSLHSYLMRQRCQRLKPQPGWESGQRTNFSNTNIPLDGIQRMELNASCDKFVAVWSVKGFMSQWMKLMTLTAKRKQNGSDIGSHLNLTIGDAGYIGSAPDKVTSMCWSPMSNIPGKACVLYTTVCPIGYRGSHVSLFNLETSVRSEEAYVFSFDLGRTSVWSSAWNQHRSRFSVGCEKKCHIIDVHTRCKWTYSTQNSDCLAQLFSPSNPHLLCAGTRNGQILILDLRASHANHNTVKLNQKRPVVCLRYMKDENYLLASDFSGLIRRWDLRYQNTIQNYSGLVNSHYQIPFYIDSTEKIIYATGSDGYCKIWSVSDGLLLKSIPPPLSLLPAEDFPVSHVSEQWGGLDGNFGVVTGMANSFFLYS